MEHAVASICSSGLRLMRACALVCGFFRGDVAYESTVEQICVCGDRMLHLYICCADQTFQVAHLHVHYEQCVKLAVTTPGHAMLLCGSLIISLL